MTSQLLTVGRRALAANFTSLQVTGNNIANANVQGYSRQRAELVTAQSRFAGGGYVGMGVDVRTVTRQYDILRSREALTAQSVAKMDEARMRGLSQLEGVFPVGEEGLGYATAQFLEAFTDVVSRPTDISARQVVLARATDLTSRFNDAARRIEQIQGAVAEEVDAGVARVNQIAAGIADVNGRLSRTQALGHTSNDLLDERDRLLAQLNELVQTTHYEADDGSMTVMIPGGHTLVLGGRANGLARVPDSHDPSRVALASVELGVSRPISQGDLSGGALTGWLRLQNEDLVSGRNEVGRLAQVLAASVNAQQRLGVDLRGLAGSPVFAVGTTQVVPSTENRRKADGSFASEVGITITDPNALAASEYALRKLSGSGAGQWQLLRLSDGLARSVVDGDVVDGFRLSIPSPEPASTDSFLLKAVAGAAAGMRRVLEDPRGLAAAAPLTARLASTNQGTATVDRLRSTTPLADGPLALQVVFTSSNGQYEIRDAAGAVVGNTPRQWKAGEPIVFEGETGTAAGVAGTYGAFELTLSGVPRQGDILAVTRTAYTSANNGNAQELLALRDAALVGRTVDAQGILDGGKTFTNAYAGVVGQVGVTVQRARTAAGISEGMARAAETARASASGVNLDEEAAQLVQFQQCYQASAKVLQAAQTVFDSLLQIGR